MTTHSSLKVTTLVLVRVLWIVMGAEGVGGRRGELVSSFVLFMQFEIQYILAKLRLIAAPETIVYLAIFGSDQLQILAGSGAGSRKPFVARSRLLAAPHLALMWRIVDPNKASMWRGFCRLRSSPRRGVLRRHKSPLCTI